MKILGIIDSPRPNDNTATFLRQVMEGVSSGNDTPAEFLHLSKGPESVANNVQILQKAYTLENTLAN